MISLYNRSVNGPLMSEFANFSSCCCIQSWVRAFRTLTPESELLLCRAGCVPLHLIEHCMQMHLRGQHSTPQLHFSCVPISRGHCPSSPDSWKPMLLRYEDRSTSLRRRRNKELLAPSTSLMLCRRQQSGESFTHSSHLH